MMMKVGCGQTDSKRGIDREYQDDRATVRTLGFRPDYLSAHFIYDVTIEKLPL